MPAGPESIVLDIANFNSTSFKSKVVEVVGSKPIRCMFIDIEESLFNLNTLINFNSQEEKSAE